MKVIFKEGIKSKQRPSRRTFHFIELVKIVVTYSQNQAIKYSEDKKHKLKRLGHGMHIQTVCLAVLFTERDSRVHKVPPRDGWRQ